MAELPGHLCYMLGNGTPGEVDPVEFTLEAGAGDHVHQTRIDIDMRVPGLTEEDLARINGKRDDVLRF